jgi:hypothetical protein
VAWYGIGDWGLAIGDRGRWGGGGQIRNLPLKDITQSAVERQAASISHSTTWLLVVRFHLVRQSTSMNIETLFPAFSLCRCFNVFFFAALDFQWPRCTIPSFPLLSFYLESTKDYFFEVLPLFSVALISKLGYHTAVITIPTQHWQRLLLKCNK